MGAVKLLRQIATGWLIVGSIGLAGTVGMAVSHSVMGAPLREGHGGGEASPQLIFTTLSVLGAIFGLFVIGGVVIFFRFPKAK